MSAAPRRSAEQPALDAALLEAIRASGQIRNPSAVLQALARVAAALILSTYRGRASQSRASRTFAAHLHQALFQDLAREVVARIAKQQATPQPPQPHEARP